MGMGLEENKGAGPSRPKGRGLSTPTPVCTETSLRVPSGLRGPIEASPMEPGACGRAQGAREPPFPPPTRDPFKRITLCN